MHPSFGPLQKARVALLDLEHAKPLVSVAEALPAFHKVAVLSLFLC